MVLTGVNYRHKGVLVRLCSNCRIEAIDLCFACPKTAEKNLTLNLYTARIRGKVLVQLLSAVLERGKVRKMKLSFEQKIKLSFQSLSRDKTSSESSNVALQHNAT
jgi:membrane carboxypeptidase/penicillin-binding protein PbpC